ncbi:MAG: metallophosphoesterase [Candidatus Acidiferrales bacterium]
MSANRPPISAAPDSGSRQHGLSRRVALLIVLIAAALLLSYALWIEPYRIEVVHTDMRAALTAPIKILQLSDLHTHGIGRRERRVFAILSEEKPDLIVVTGDSLAGWGGTYGMAQDVYKQLHAPLGVWVVRGNFENWKPLTHERAFYTNAGVHLLLNSGTLVRPDIWLGGVDDPYTGKANADAALAGAPPSAFKILLFHSPAYFDLVAGRVDLCLAGHTHGGQVRLPFLEPLWLPKGCWPYVAGWYQIGDTKMYVNRGLGWSILPIRFNSRPEVTVLTIHP